MGPGIIIPLVVIALIVPIAMRWAKRTLKEGAGRGTDDVAMPSARLTSNALRELHAPPWRVVYEIADERLGEVGHVVIGPAGIFALRTTMDPVPDPTEGDPSPHAVAAAAIARGDLDDALRRCAMSSDLLVSVHWGAPRSDGLTEIAPVPGEIAIDGRSLTTWFEQRDGSMSPAQVDLAWQTVTVALGRPDPLA